MYKIIEIANTHGGDEEYMLSLIKVFESENENTGIKFQPFKYDRIATNDFEWYPVYQKLFFNPIQWKNFIEKAYKTKDVWLDIFDDYGISIILENKEKVFGIKLQTSVLSNLDVIDKLKQINLSKQVLIINIAGREMNEIDYWVNFCENELNIKELWLEVGFQAYPTDLDDSGINKIKPLKERYGKKIVFADHLDGKKEDAQWLPVIAMLEGADVIEKHVMLADRHTEYDHFSSLTPDQYFILSMRLDSYFQLKDQPFINEKETSYLNKTEMKPIINKDKLAGQGIKTTDDLLFRRSGQDGISSSVLKKIFRSKQILKNNKQLGQTFNIEDFKPARIAAIIACRLKSSRLKSKALLKIGNLTSVEYCIKNALRFKNVDDVILATSTNNEDADLVNYTYSKQVIFHKGHPEDVIQRYLDIVREKKIDVIIRITADMPFVDDEILQILLSSHFENGADYTIGKDAAVGTNLEIINAEALERVKSYFPNADYSEYMTWYFQNNPEEFVLNYVELPENLVRNYRLTLDYQEDLEVFNMINQYFEKQGKTDFILKDIFKYLDENSLVSQINGSLTLKYKTDNELIETLNRVTKISKE